MKDISSGALNAEQARLQQVVRMRWNCTCYMMKSLIAQKQALCDTYTAEYDQLVTLTANQWGLLFEHDAFWMTRLSTVHPPDKCVMTNIYTFNNLLSIYEREKDGIGPVSVLADTQGCSISIRHKQVV